MADKSYVFNVISDLISDFLYYDRKEDGELEQGEIERMVESGEISIHEIVAQFEIEIKRGLGVEI